MLCADEFGWSQFLRGSACGGLKREARKKSEYSLPRGFAAKKRGGNWK
jgi:hypothetical protein